MKVIKGTNARSVTNRKARNNGMEIILFQIGSKSCVGSNFKFNRNKDSAKHVGREPWFRAKDRIAVLHKIINWWQIKIPKLIKDLPRGRREGSCSIRIIFTKLSQDTFLIGGMTADVNRFQ